MPCEAEAGDVLFFTDFTVHGSGVDASDEARTTMLVQYRDPLDRAVDDRHSGSLGQGMMLRGIDPSSRRPSSQHRSVSRPAVGHRLHHQIKGQTEWRWS